MNIFLVMCGKSKVQYQTSAKNLYNSERFILSRKLAEEFGDKWFIVSAKHGLVHPNTVLEPYDFSIEMLGQRYIKKWSLEIFNSLKKYVINNSGIILLGERQYFVYLSRFLEEANYTVYNISERVKFSQAKNWLLNTQSTSQRFLDLKLLYELLDNLHDHIFSIKESSLHPSNLDIPPKGLYLFFQNDEKRLLDNRLRIIRVGTHGVSEGSKSSLQQRLRQHIGSKNGLGNHRSSVFRQHIGNALINKEKIECTTWNNKNCPPGKSLEIESKIEKKVSEYISNMKFLFLEILDKPSKYSDRAYMEQNIISLIAGFSPPIDVAKEGWLGYFSSNEFIRYSSLWNVNYTKQNYDRRFFDILKEYIDITLGLKTPSLKSLAPKDWYQKARKNYIQEELNF